MAQNKNTHTLCPFVRDVVRAARVGSGGRAGSGKLFGAHNLGILLCMGGCCWSGKLCGYLRCVKPGMEGKVGRKVSIKF